MIASLAAGVCPERVRLLTGTPKAQVSARKRSGNRTADLSGHLNRHKRCLERALESGGSIQLDRGTHRRGAAPQKRLISQVQGQKGGTCIHSAGYCCWRTDGTQNPAF